LLDSAAAYQWFFSVPHDALMELLTDHLLNFKS
jgi:hypothetical protein